MYDVLGSLRDLDQLLENTLKLVIEVVGADRGVLVLRNRRTGRYEVAAARGMQKRAQIKALAVSRTVIREVVRSGTPIAAEDVELDLKLRDVESIQLHRIGGLACTPLVAGDHVLGALYVDCLGRGVSFLPGTKSLLNSISACVAVAIQNAWTQIDQVQANARLRDRNLELARAAGAVEARYELVGSSRPMQALRDQTRSVADTESSVLIVGASGTGKELVARSIHAWSPRSHQPFVAAVLATIPDSLVASTLFGIEKAKATGVEKSLGLFETVGEGVLFLDEITDVGRDVQTALLRVIEQREFSRIGSEGKSLPFRGRLVFATNRDPERAIRDGLLREDLYFRIAAFVIETPSLTEHRSDIPELIEHFRGQYRERYGRNAVPPPFEFIEACLRDPWPGNVRELKHVVERAETTARDPEDWVSVYREHVSRRPGAVPTLRSVSYAERLREFERNELTRALRSADWNQAAAARLLSMPEATLRYKVKTLGIEISEREQVGRQSG
jgi:transcriptional regulator with GAF, ATPase, and Fis domain